MHTVAFYIVGFPEETEETLQDTINAIKNTPGDVTYSIFTPYKGTPAFEISKELGLIPENIDVSLYNHISPENNFCKYIQHDRFRAIVSKVEKLVDRKNKYNDLKISLSGFSPLNMLNKMVSLINHK